MSRMMLRSINPPKGPFVLLLALCLSIGCGPAPKSESVVAFEGFLRAVYANDIPGVLSSLTPAGREKLKKQLGVAGRTSSPLEGHVTIALGWEFERVSSRTPKVDPKRSDSSRHVLGADIGGEPWHIVMKHTADGWKLDLFDSKPTPKVAP